MTEAAAAQTPSTASSHALPTTGVRGSLATLVMLADSPLLALVFTALPPALPAIAAHFGGGESGAFIAQMVMTMPSIGLMLGGFFSGWLVDRFGPRTTMLGALIAVAVMGSAGMFIDGAWLLLGTRLILGFAAVTVGTSVGSFIGLFVSEERRPRIQGWRNAFGGFVGLIGTYSAGPVTEYLGWRSAFAIYGIAAALVFVLTIMIIPETPPQQRKTTTATPKVSLRSLAPVLPFYLLAAPFAVIMMINGAQLSFLMSGDGVISAVTQSWIIGLGSVFSATASIFYPAIRRNLGGAGTFSLMALCLGGGTLTVGLTHSLWIQALGSAITGFGCGVHVPYFYNAVYEYAPRASWNRGIGFMFSAIFMGDFFNPVILGAVSHAVGGNLHMMFIIVGTVVATAALSPLFIRRRTAPLAAPS